MRRAAALLLLAGAAYAAAFVVYGERRRDALEPVQLGGAVTWPEGDARRLLLAGDSRVAQWPVRAPAGWAAAKLGYGGATAPNIERAVAPLLPGARPDAVVIQAGINDATAAAMQFGEDRDATLRAARDAVLRLAEAARAAGAETVVVLTPRPPMRLELWKRLLLGSRATTLARRLSRELAPAARARGFAVVDTEAVLPAAARFRRDGLHWTPEAYRVLERVVRSRLSPRT